MSERSVEVWCKGADGDYLCVNNNEVAGGRPSGAESMRCAAEVPTRGWSSGLEER
jgi:hypothetical protein